MSGLRPRSAAGLVQHQRGKVAKHLDQSLEAWHRAQCLELRIAFQPGQVTPAFVNRVLQGLQGSLGFAQTGVGHRHRIPQLFGRG